MGQLLELEGLRAQQVDLPPHETRGRLDDGHRQHEQERKHGHALQLQLPRCLVDAALGVLVQALLQRCCGHAGLPGLGLHGLRERGDVAGRIAVALQRTDQGVSPVPQPLAGRLPGIARCAQVVAAGLVDRLARQPVEADGGGGCLDERLLELLADDRSGGRVGARQQRMPAELQRLRLQQAGRFDHGQVARARGVQHQRALALPKPQRGQGGERQVDRHPHAPRQRALAAPARRAGWRGHRGDGRHGLRWRGARETTASPLLSSSAGRTAAAARHGTSRRRGSRRQSGQSERGHLAGQPRGLLLQRAGRCRGLLDQRRVLLRDRVQFLHGLGRLRDALGLLA